MSERISRHELFVTTVESNADPEKPLTPEAYMEILHTRGSEKIADAQLVQSFSTTIRTLNPTYVYGVDFFWVTITIADERLGIVIDAVWKVLNGL